MSVSVLGVCTPSSPFVKDAFCTRAVSNLVTQECEDISDIPFSYESMMVEQFEPEKGNSSAERNDATLLRVEFEVESFEKLNDRVLVL